MGEGESQYIPEEAQIGTSGVDRPMDSEDVRRQRETGRYLDRAGEFLADLFRNNSTSEERMAKFRQNIGGFVKSAGEYLDVPALELSLQQCAAAMTEEEFIERGLAAVRPIIALQIDRPDLARKAFYERHEFTPLSRALSFGVTEDGYVAHIHLAPAADIRNLREDVTEGLHKLADLIRENPDQYQALERITATSWIVSEHPRVLERLGFTIDGPVSEASARHRREQGETRPASRAHIDIPDFLAKY